MSEQAQASVTLAATPRYVPLRPRHLGIMMDGNGRWAARRGLPRLAGHRAGVQNVQRVLQACGAHGIHVVTLYVFSSENWGRPIEEVRGFFGLLAEVIEAQTEAFRAQGVQLRHSGSLEGVPPALARQVERAVAVTRHNRDYILNVAFSYGGRNEILNAARRLARAGVAAQDLDERRFEAELDTAGLPDIDLVIRSGGEARLSNFFPWQAAFAEFYITPVLWPDMDAADIDRAVAHYQTQVAAREAGD